MDSIYVVEGSAGEYSDWTTWIVCAYTNEQIAREHAERAQAEMAERKELLGEMDFSRREAWEEENPARYDPEPNRDLGWSSYDDFNYTVTKVDIRKQLPRPRRSVASRS